jgi:long-chain acyl-CoA synthetase
MSLAHGSAEFLVYERQRYTFDEHYRYAARVAHRLIDNGVTNGDRVAIASRNLPQWVMSFWGGVVAGAVVVPLNAWWTSEEIEYGLRDSSCSVVFVDAERLERILPLLDELVDLSLVVVYEEDPSRPAQTLATHPRVSIVPFSEFVGQVSRDERPPDVGISSDDLATIFYSSGTTGRPKGVMGTHRNVCSNLMCTFFVGQRQMLRFADIGAAAARTSSSYLLSVPLFHATGCLAILAVNTAVGSKIVMMHHFDPALALKVIEAERITAVGGVPTIVMQLIDHPDFAATDTSSVQLVFYGGAPAPPELVRRIETSFPGRTPSNGYGLTETSAGVCWNSGPDYVAKPASCGPPVPVIDVAIVPEEFDGEEPSNDLPRGPDVVGELWIKGPNVVRGYWNKPEATAASFTKGWLHTGDIARIDEDGFVFIVDRAKDMIIRGGENVYSVGVEAALFEHRDVADCAVVGIPHPTLGEEVAAVIVLRPGRVIEAEEIIRHVTPHLAKFEIPTRIFFRSEMLPRNAQGKVLKRELRAALVELMSDGYAVSEATAS